MEKVAFTIRIPSEIKALLEQRAKENDRTLNNEVIRILKIVVRQAEAA
jgi:predicted HicB family RNase H-like nuclease